MRHLFALALALWPLAHAAAAGRSADHVHRQHPPAAGAWSAYPLIAVKNTRGDRASLEIAVTNLAADAIEVFAPALDAAQQRRRVALESSKTRVRALEGLGNYYWFIARAEDGTHVHVASTTHYFSNPGPAPTAMLEQAKNELEIVPRPLPREHGHYREDEAWAFQLRFRDAPLARTVVTLTTEHGSTRRYATDADGVARVTFPRDIPAANQLEAGHHGPARSGFVLAAEHEAGGRHYLTAFNHVYTPHAQAGRNLWAGAGFMLLGMVLAVPLLRRPST